jgi:hypothetical protein
VSPVQSVSMLSNPCLRAVVAKLCWVCPCMTREARKRRDAQWVAFVATRPDDKYENQDDLTAIQAAEDSMGDYKLKLDLTYVPPEVRLHAACTSEVELMRWHALCMRLVARTMVNSATF